MVLENRERGSGEGLFKVYGIVLRDDVKLLKLERRAGSTML